jgi:1,4-dihydroxy-2-naphthoate octaprenyltransferase
MPKVKTGYDSKITAIKNMLQMFKLERVIYIIVTLVCFVVLIGSAIFMLYSDHEDKMPAVIGMFGSSGAIAYTAGRLLKMWSDAMKLLMDIEDKKDTDNE